MITTMYKFILLISLLGFNSAFAMDTVNETITEIEMERNAKCEHIHTSKSAFCFSFICFSKSRYFCTSRENDFLVELEIGYGRVLSVSFEE